MIPPSPRMLPALDAVCSLARLTPEPGPPARALSPAELEGAVQAAHAHNALGVLLPALRRGGLPIPAALEERLAAAEPALAAQALFREAGLQEVLRLLARADVEAAVLKGAFLASCVYGDFAERPMNDFDLLVRREDLPRAGHALREAGYALE
ncbi:MAG TPA: nucleotidyltransferase family protein, partial [Candidatus Methylomirabilis sp.]|nr:nucleotidyltransferase family protein [Candidatus Methylomirabilis sp.]